MSTTRKVLIVEDSEAKLSSVISAVQGILPDASIDCARSVKSALNTLKAATYDLIIADMSLPTFDVKSRERGGTARPFGGIEIFDYLLRIQSTCPVVVVTSYPAIVDGSTSLTLPDLAKRLKRDYPGLFVGSVFFDSAYLTWELELQALIREARNG